MKAPSSRPAGPAQLDFSVLFMNRAHVDQFVKWDTNVVADVAAGTMTQADRFDSAMKFFLEVLASVYLVSSAIELGCKTIKDAIDRFPDVQARAQHQLGFDPVGVLEAEPPVEGDAEFKESDPLIPAEEIRDFVTSVLAWTELETLLKEAHVRREEGRVLGLVRKLTALLRRLDAFCAQRVRILAEKYAIGELSVAQCAQVLGVDEADVLAQFAKPARGAQTHAYRPSADDGEGVRAGLEQAAAGARVALSPEELARWEATGELPASIEARFAECGSPN